MRWERLGYATSRSFTAAAITRRPFTETRQRRERGNLRHQLVDVKLVEPSRDLAELRGRLGGQREARTVRPRLPPAAGCRKSLAAGATGWGS